MSPARAEDHVASYDILVDGAQLDQELRDRIKEVRVVDHLRLPDVCTVQVQFPRGEGVDAMPFEIGKDLEVRLGSRDELAPQSLFKGAVATIEAQFGAGGCQVLVRSFDHSHVLHRSRRIRTFQNMTSSDIVEKVLREAGLSAQCEPSGEPHEHLHQKNETDWDFIWRLAERIGFEFVVADKVGRFGPPASDGLVELEWPVTLRSFRPRVTAVQQVEEVTLRAWDPRSKREIASSATQPHQIASIGIDRASVVRAAGQGSIQIATESVAGKGEADAMAQALLDRLANAYVGADGVAAGDPRVKAGAKVKISGVGAKFGGTYRVATSTHVLRGGGTYETHFANSPSHTLLGALGGGAGAGAPSFSAQFAIGIVTNNQDPDELGRVKVKLPALSDETESTWARCVTLNAGSERGVYMLPDIDDEVLVGFLSGDASYPVVLGSLFNGVDKPGSTLVQGGDVSFALKSDHRAHLESAEDFTIKSGQKLDVTVQSGVTLSGSDAIDIKGSGDVTLGGDRTVTIEGMTTLTLKCGPSKVELSSAGVTVSGPMINLG